MYPVGCRSGMDYDAEFYILNILGLRVHVRTVRCIV